MMEIAISISFWAVAVILIIAAIMLAVAGVSMLHDFIQDHINRRH